MNERTFFCCCFVAEPAVQETIETSPVPEESVDEYVGQETIPETVVVPEKMSPPLPQPVPVIESALSYDAKSFEPKKQREQVQRESVERSSVDMDIKQGKKNFCEDFVWGVAKSVLSTCRTNNN